MPAQFFDKQLATLWQNLDQVLAGTLLAAYLLGLDQARGEVQQPQALTPKSQTHLAEGDDKPVYTIGDNPTLKLRFNVPPEEAIDYFKRKKIVPKKEFGDLRDEARSAAFTVGGIYQTDVLAAFKDEITEALANGTPQAKVIGRFKDILAGAGHRELGNFHLETVWRTNAQMAYGVGRRRALEEVAEDLPFWERVAVLDDRTRPAHA